MSNQSTQLLNFTERNGVQTMSSLELAKLCVGDTKNAHSDFVKKMKKVLGETNVGNFSDIYLDARNREQTLYHLPEREACLMAMSYSYDLQAYVYDEWQRLKIQNNPQVLPDFTDPVKAARAWADECEAKQIALADVARLEDKVQDEGQWRSLKACNLPQNTVSTTLPKGKRQTWRILKDISNDLGYVVKKVFDVNYGEVNSYHIDVIAQYKAKY